MTAAALLLIDFQEDFLGAEGLSPPRSCLIGQAANLLDRWRAAQLPVWHIKTTLNHADERMAHWKRSGRFSCRAGTPGHETPSPVAPIDGESVVHKRRFSGFFGTALFDELRAAGIDTVVLAGVHLHSCVRATALDAYQFDLTVLIATDAVASDDPLHAAATQRYLDHRVAEFQDSETLLQRLSGRSVRVGDAPILPALRIGKTVAAGSSTTAITRPCPSHKREILWRFHEASAEQVAQAAQAARAAGPAWRKLSLKERRRRVEKLGILLTTAREKLAQCTAREIGKPMATARGEVDFALSVLDAALRAHDKQRGHRGDGWRAWRAPLGVVAALTPFNNPVASFIGKAAPALLFGDTVVWKPAPAATGVSLAMMDLVDMLDLPIGAVSLLCGDAATATALIERPEVDAISLTGGPLSGMMAQAIAAARAIPLQAELGGNNAAIILRDADLVHAAGEVARGAFGSAGQRCTANRRVIVEESIFFEMRDRLMQVAGDLAWGDPLDEATQIGPLVSERALLRTKSVLADAEQRGAKLLFPDAAKSRWPQLAEVGFYHPPTLVLSDRADLEIVREETFGPVLVLQPARDLEHALELLSAPRQGLTAALFTSSQRSQRRFMDCARTGLVKINQGTTGAVADAPFGGWGASGVGPAEHGPADAEFFGRWQTICQESSRVP